MPKYKDSNISQGQFLTVNLSEQLLPDTFEWTINYLIDKMDLSSFDKNYNNDELGAAAYPPKVLLKIIIYCYSRGILSSRNIEKACKDNVIVKALAEDFEPDHDTIAAFISTNSEAVKDLFTQVLLQCAELKLITGEMFAIDGCKLPSNASKEWSGTIADLQKKQGKLKKYINRLILKHQELDKDEESKKKLEPYRKALKDDNDRRGKSIERLEKKLAKFNRFLEDAQPRKGAAQAEVQSNITDNESARIKGPHGYIQGYNGVTAADSGNQVIIAAEASGSVSESVCFPDMLDMLNTNMQKVSRKKKPLKKSIVLADTGLFSEDNLQEAKKRDIDVIIPDPQFRKRDPVYGDRQNHKDTDTKKYYGIEDFTYNKNDDSYTCPAGNVLPFKCNVEFKSRGTKGKQYRSLKSVCSVCPLKAECINRKPGKSEFRALFIAEQKYEENLSEKMRHKIDDPAYREIYSRRMQIIEPVFSNMVSCKGMNRFTLRTQKKVNIQWLLYTIVHNMWKCIKPLGLKYRN